VLNLTFLGLLAASNPMAIGFGYPLALRLGMLLPLLSIVPAIAALIYMVLAWRDRLWSLAMRVHFTLIALATPIFLWQLRYWYLLGWRL
jgi:glycerol-3-phosphate acyltransferase PlsY